MLANLVGYVSLVCNALAVRVCGHFSDALGVSA